MTKREFLDTVFALAPNEANAIMDAFDEYVDSNEGQGLIVFAGDDSNYIETLESPEAIMNLIKVEVTE